MTRRLFHLADPGELLAGLAASGVWAPPSLEREGFVHLSFGEQLPGTLAAHFPRAGELLLVEVVLEDAGALALEVSRGGERFPHLGRALARGELARHWVLRPAAGTEGPPERRNRGLPALGSTPVLDDPRGVPGLPSRP